jgi:hypothetical protein
VQLGAAGAAGARLAVGVCVSAVHYAFSLKTT